MKLLRLWNRYWFRPFPLIYLAISRVVIVSFQLIYLLRRDYQTEFLRLVELPESMYDPLPIYRLLA